MRFGRALLSTVRARLADRACINGADLLWIKLWKLWIPASSYCVAGLVEMRAIRPVARPLNRAVPALTVARATLVR